jgi:hypothetical protein
MRILWHRQLVVDLEQVHKWAREQAGWRWIDMSTGHLPMVTAPAELSRVLIELAAR